MDRPIFLFFVGLRKSHRRAEGHRIVVRMQNFPTQKEGWPVKVKSKAIRLGKNLTIAHFSARRRQLDDAK